MYVLSQVLYADVITRFLPNFVRFTYNSDFSQEQLTMTTDYKQRSLDCDDRNDGNVLLLSSSL